MSLRLAIGDWRLPKLAIGIWPLAIGAALVCYGSDAGDGSLSESKIDTTVQTATAEPLLEQNEQLRKQLSIAQESLKALTSSLAESNAAAEELRRKYSDLELRMEALGLASPNKDRTKLGDEYRDQMLRLNEAVLCYLKTSQAGDAKARMDVEAQLRSTNTLITKSTSEPELPESSLMDGSVISVKDEWSFVVGNLGEKQGVKIGMPMRVMRDDRKIATLRVVDVRQKICGAVIQEMDSEKEKIKVGDRLQVDAHSDVSLR